VNLDLEAPHDLLQCRHVGERTLSGAYNEQTTIQLLLACLDHLLHIERHLRIVVDVLLDLVQHQHGAG
jgi:hypothetical protein